MSQHICVGCKGTVESDGMIPVGWTEYRLLYKSRPETGLIETGKNGELEVCGTCKVVNAELCIYSKELGVEVLRYRTFGVEPIASNEPVACSECTGLGGHLSSCSKS